MGFREFAGIIFVSLCLVAPLKAQSDSLSQIAEEVLMRDASLSLPEIEERIKQAFLISHEDAAVQEVFHLFVILEKWIEGVGKLERRGPSLGLEPLLSEQLRKLWSQLQGAIERDVRGEFERSDGPYGSEEIRQNVAIEMVGILRALTIQSYELSLFESQSTYDRLSKMGNVLKALKAGTAKISGYVEGKQFICTIALFNIAPEDL